MRLHAAVAAVLLAVFSAPVAYAWIHRSTTSERLASATDWTRSAYELLKVGDKAGAARAIQEGRAEYLSATRGDPDSYQGYVGLAHISDEYDKDPAQSLAWYDKAFAVMDRLRVPEPAYVEPLTNRAIVLNTLGVAAQGRAPTKNSVAASEPYFQRALDDVTKAQQIVRRAGLRIEPRDHFRLVASMGRARMSLGDVATSVRDDHRAAIALYDKAALGLEQALKELPTYNNPLQLGAELTDQLTRDLSTLLEAIRDHREAVRKELPTRVPG